MQSDMHAKEVPQACFKHWPQCLGETKKNKEIKEKEKIWYLTMECKAVVGWYGSGTGSVMAARAETVVPAGLLSSRSWWWLLWC